MSATIIKLATTDCGNIEIHTTANIKTSELIKGLYDIDYCINNYIDMTSIGHQGLTATQARRFYAVWEFLTSPCGTEYLERVNIDYWQYRNYRLDDCLDQPLKDAMKSTPDERPGIMTDLANITVVPYFELETNEHTKEFLDKGYISMKYVSELLKYSNFLGVEFCIRFFAGCFAGNLKRLVKVFPVPPPNKDDKPGLEADEFGFVEESIVSMTTDTTSTQDTMSETAGENSVAEMLM